MGVHANSPALIAAFAFGIVTVTAAGCIIFYIAGSAYTRFRLGLRPVLFIFLVTAGLWAFTEFLATTVAARDERGCQVAVTFATLFDQLARSSLEQLLLCIIWDNLKTSPGLVFLQAGVLLRFVLGCVFIGFERSQFHPVCNSTGAILPLGAVLLTWDLVVLLTLTCFAISACRGGLAQVRKTHSRCLLSLLANALVWTMTSAPMLLGSESMSFASRTIAPAAGLLVVLTTMMVVSNGLARGLSDSPEHQVPSMTWRNNPFTRDLVGGGRSITSQVHDHQDSPIWAGPSNSRIITTIESQKVRNPPDTLGEQSSFEKQGGKVPLLVRCLPRWWTTSGLFTFGKQKRTANKAIRKNVHDGHVAISSPRLNYHQSLNRITTINLETAIKFEEERRSLTPRVLQMTGFHPNTVSAVSTKSDGMTTATKTSRAAWDGQREYHSSAFDTWEKTLPAKPSAVLKVGQMNDFTPFSLSHRSKALPPTPLERHRVRPRPALKSLDMCEFYGDAKPRLGEARVKHNTIQALAGRAERDETVVGKQESESIRLSPQLRQRIASVINRPRPVPRKTAGLGSVFLSDKKPAVLGHRRSLSAGTLGNNKGPLFSATPGSPTMLPPLPPAPKSAGLLRGSHQDDHRTGTKESARTWTLRIPSSGETSQPLTVFSPSLWKRGRRSSRWDSLTRNTASSTRSSIATADLLRTSSASLHLRTELEAAKDRAAPALPDFDYSPSSSQDDQEAAVVPPPRKSQSSDLELESPTSLPARSLSSQDASLSDNVSTTSWRQIKGHWKRVLHDARDRNTPERPSMAATGQTFSQPAIQRDAAPPAPLTLPSPPSRSVRHSLALQTTTPASTPSDASEHAIDMIDEQLKKLERNKRFSTGTERQRRSKLLDSLEAEMGQEERRWETMQQRYSRASLSSFRTSPTIGSTLGKGNVSPDRSPAISSVLSDNRLSRVLEWRSSSGLAASSVPPQSIMTAKTGGSSPQHADGIMRWTTDQLTPPDTDESNAGNQSDGGLVPFSGVVTDTLEDPPPYAVAPSTITPWLAQDGALPTARLWLTDPSPSASPHPRSEASEPSPSREAPPLDLEAAHSPPSSSPTTMSFYQQIRSQRSLRRVRRSSSLPDIVESPLPIPHKGTLGIFQLPSGERSDVAPSHRFPQNMLSQPQTPCTFNPHGYFDRPMDYFHQGLWYADSQYPLTIGQRGYFGAPDASDDSSSEYSGDQHDVGDDSGHAYDDEVGHEHNLTFEEYADSLAAPTRLFLRDGGSGDPRQSVESVPLVLDLHHHHE